MKYKSGSGFILKFLADPDFKIDQPDIFLNLDPDTVQSQKMDQVCLLTKFAINVESLPQI